MSTLIAESRLLASFGVALAPCRYCGFSPVRIETTNGRGVKEFAFTCPNDTCPEHWKSCSREAWKPAKREAAAEWNLANAVGVNP